MRVVEGGNYSYTRGVKYPIAVQADTEYRLANFAQEFPHTAIFSVFPGVLVRFVGCNLVNVTVPDGAEIVGGNLAHVVPAPTGDANRPTVNLLCECRKCATALGELRERIAAGTLPKDASGRILHHQVKGALSARRADALKVTADRTLAADGNAAAMAKFGRTVTVALRTQVGRGT